MQIGAIFMSNDIERCIMSNDLDESKRVIETLEAKIKSMELDVDKVRCFEAGGINSTRNFYWDSLEKFKWIGLKDDDK